MNTAVYVHKFLRESKFLCFTVDEILTRTDRLHHHADDCDTRKVYKNIMQRLPQPGTFLGGNCYAAYFKN